MGDEISATSKIYYIAAAASCVAVVTAATVYAMLVKRRKKSNDQAGKSFRNASTVSYDSAGQLKSIPFFVQHKMAPLDTFRPSLKASFSASDSEGGLINDSVQKLTWGQSSLDYSTASAEQEWRVWFKLIYDEASENLKLTIFRIKGMASSASRSSQTSVFFICYLLPDQTTKLQTAMYLNNGNVYFDETLTFYVPSNQILAKKLRLSLYEMDCRRNRNTLGHILIKLKDINIDNKTAHYLCRDTAPDFALIKDSSGEVHLSLSYDREREKLRLQIFAAKDLPKVPITSSFYLVTNIMVGVKTAKTKLGSIHPSLEGIFNVTYNFRLALKLIDNNCCCLRFTVMQIDSTIGQSSSTMAVRSKSSTSSGSFVGTPSPKTPKDPVDFDEQSAAADSAFRGSVSDAGGGLVVDPGVAVVDYDKKPWGYFVVGPNNFTHGSGLAHWNQMLANNKQIVEMWHKIVEYEQ